MGTRGRRLIERESEIVTIASAIADAISGNGSLVVVGGPAGIGKSRLLAQARTQAKEAGMRLLQARGGELEHDVTFGVARQLFERMLHGASPAEREELLAGSAGLATVAMGIDTEAGSVAPETGPVHGLFWLVCNLAAAGPTALLVDDAQWADEESLRFLLYLARRIEGLPLVVVLAARPREPDGQTLLIETISAEPAVRRIDLQPLSPAGSALLLADRLTGVSDAVAGACHAVSGGNPFYMSELAGLVGADAGDEEDLLIRVRSLAPPTVQRAILMRLGHERETVRRTAVALAILGEGTTVSLVAAVSGLQEEDVVTALGVLADASIATAADEVALAHPIIRTAIYSDLAEPRRSALHGVAARAMLERHAPDEAIAHHLVLTEPDGDPHVAEILLEAGRQAASRGATATAIRLLGRALAEPPAPAVRPLVLAALGPIELAVGDAGVAAGYLLDALEADLAPDVRAAVAQAAAAALMESGRQRTGLEVLQREIARLGEDQPDLALRLDAEHSLLCIYIPELSQAGQERMRSYSGLAGVTASERVALALASLSCAFNPASCAADAVTLARRASEGDRLITEQPPDSTMHANAHYALLQAEDLETYEAGVEASRADAQRRGSTFGFLTATLGDLLGATVRGDVVAAKGSAERALELWPELEGDVQDLHWTSFAIRFAAEALLMDGDVQGARDLVAGGMTLGDLDTVELSLVRYAHGLVAAAEGAHDDALRDFLGYGETSSRTWAADRISPWRLGAARALAGLGDTERAVALADEAVTAAEHWGAPGGLGAAQRVRALVGAPEEAPVRLEHAVLTLRDSVRRLELANALIDLGMARRRLGQRRAARAPLEEGMELAARCRAAPSADRARAELVALGTRPRRQMFSGVEGLTASERRVGSLASGGLINREIAQALFVTEKTVEAHLTNVYRKLDIRSRAELAEALEGAAA